MNSYKKESDVLKEVTGETLTQWDEVLTIEKNPHAEISTSLKIDRRAFVGGVAIAAVGAGLIADRGHATELGFGLPDLEPLANSEIRLLFDRMLAGHGRWLRAAGYDVAFPASTMPSHEIMLQAASEGRIFVSRNLKVDKNCDDSSCLVLIHEQNLPEVAAELTQRLGIDWMHDPFSRCLQCNTPVDVVDPGNYWPSVDRANLVSMLPLTRCAPCDQLYWRGGHISRMRARLEAWAAGQFI